MNKTLTFAVGLAAMLTLASCGGSEADAEATPALIIDGQAVDTSGTDSDTDGDTGNDTSEESTDFGGAQLADDMTEEELALAFVDCMQDNGIDFPDPQVNPDGSVVLLPGGPIANGVPIGTPEFDSAAAICGPLIEDASFLPTNQIDIEELEDTLLAFAACVRDQGIDISDPDLSEGFPPPDGPAAMFGGFDPIDPANADLVATCRQAALDATGFEPPGGA